MSKKAPGILDALWPIYQKEKSERGKKCLRIVDLEEAILRAADQLHDIVILVDAVNESFDRSRLLVSLVNLVKKARRLRLVITSTFDVPDAITNVRELCKVKRVGMDAKRVNNDIEIYIEAKVEQEPNLCGLNHNMKDQIASTLSQKAGGS